MQTLTRAKSRKNRKNKLNRELKKELGKKLLGYSAAAGAVLAIGAAVSEEASATPFKVTNETPITVGIGAIELIDINNDEINDFSFKIIVDGYSTTAFASGVIAANKVHASFWESETSNGYDAIALGTGAVIGSILFGNFGTNPVEGEKGGAPSADLAWDDPSETAGAFLNNRGFLGVSFDISNSTHYGWFDLEVIFQNDVLSQILIYGWGYETDPVTEINAGEPVPEPATLVTLAMGAAGLYAWRRNRKRKSVKKQDNNK